MFPSEHYLQSSWVFLVLGTRDGALQEVTWSKQRGGTGTISSDVQFIATIKRENVFILSYKYQSKTVATSFHFGCTGNMTLSYLALFPSSPLWNGKIEVVLESLVVF